VIEKHLDVVCIGNAIVDVISHADDVFLERHDLVKGSMQLIDDDVVHSLYDAMPPAVETSGGSVANTAAGIASFGGSAAFVGKVADDELGEVFTHDLRAAGVEFRPLRPGAAAEGHATARCLILVTPDGERTMSTFLGVSAMISPADVDLDLVGAARVVFCEGYLWDRPEAKQALLTAMEGARPAGTRTAFALSDSFCVDRHRAEFVDLAEHHVDILIGNETEICSLYETESFDEAAARVSAHCELAVLTRGARGATVVLRGGEQIHVDAVPVAHVVDTTGAGDLFAAGFLHALTHGEPLDACARLGALGAAEVISHIGPRPEVSLAELAKES
jgi:sugar/nucleoside kinase (ribokinase family)